MLSDVIISLWKARSLTNSKYLSWYTIKSSSSKVSTWYFVIHFKRNFSASRSFHHSVLLCQLRAISGNNQLLPWQPCFFFKPCWLYHTQWRHGLLIELQLTPNPNHLQDYGWERMFWSFLELKKHNSIVLSDQSTSEMV